jgi:cyclophilin family peptidyl-prolyl cis-trans isomerase
MVRTILLAAGFAGLLAAGAALAAETEAPAPAPTPDVKVRVETTMGNFIITLHRAKAPKTVENFLAYVREGHYNNKVFYRVKPLFVVQTGSYDAGGDYHAPPRHPPLPLETASGLSNVSTTVAMARHDEPNSAVAEWFINVADNGALDAQPGAAPNTTGYAVFGTVTEGMDVVDRISRAPTGGKGPFGAEFAPKKPVVIKRIRILE